MVYEDRLAEKSDIWVWGAIGGGRYGGRGCNGEQPLHINQRYYGKENYNFYVVFVCLFVFCAKD